MTTITSPRISLLHAAAGPPDYFDTSSVSSVSLYKVHAGKRERAGGLRFNKGDVVTLQLDLDKQTLAFTVNGSDFVAPFTNVRGPVIPAISTDNKTVCRLTIDKCSHW